MPYSPVITAQAVLFDFQIDGDDCLDNFPSPLVESALGIFLIFVESLIPLMILIYCYGRILWIIRARIGSNVGSEDAQRATFELARNNLIKTLFIVAFFIVVCYTGIDAIYLYSHLGGEVDWSSDLYHFCLGMYFLSCTINPFIYLVNYKDFQKALMEQFCCRKSRHESDSELTGSTVTASTRSTTNGQM